MSIKINLYNFIVGAIVLLMFFSEVLPKYSTYLDITIVIFVMVGYFNRLMKTGVKFNDFVIIIFALALILLTLEISRISIFCFFALLNFSGQLSKKTLHICLVMSVICFSVIVFSYFCFGFNGQYDTYIFRHYLNQSLFRRSCGFTHPNQCMFQLFCIFIFVCLYTNKLKYYFLMYGISILFYAITLSRTGFFCITLLFIIILVERVLKVRRIKEFLIWIAPYCFILLTIFSVIVSLVFSNTAIDELLTGRLALNKKFLISGLSFLGNASLENQILDNSYIHMLLTKGILYFVAYAFLITYYLKKCRNNFRNSLLILAVLAFGFCEVILLKYNVMLIFAFLVCNKEVRHDSQNNSLLLVRKGKQIRPS